MGSSTESQYDAARRDLERELLVDVGDAPIAAAGPGRGGRWTALVLALAVPVAAVGLYMTIGQSTIIPRLESLAVNQAGGSLPGHPAAMRRRPPSKTSSSAWRSAWRRTRATWRAGSYSGAPTSPWTGWRRGPPRWSGPTSSHPRSPRCWWLLAQALAGAQEGSLAGRPAALIRTALNNDPNNLTARWLEGLMAYQEERFSEAAVRWEALLATVDPNSDEAAELTQMAAEARARAGGALPLRTGAATPPSAEGEAAPPQTAGPADEPKEPAAPAAAGPSVAVEVALAEPLWTQASVNDTVFVYAKASAGPPMPLAVKQIRVAELPATVTLDDSMAMMPAMRLSAFPDVIVGARISKTGQATPQSGDLEGEVGPINPTGQTGPVAVVIDQVRP
jgi:cytochrome c-type biogenesis protein CcmH